jgi:hypothetical protein
VTELFFINIFHKMAKTRHTKKTLITPPSYKFRLLSRLSFEVYSPVHKKDPCKFNVFIHVWFCALHSSPSKRLLQSSFILSRLSFVGYRYIAVLSSSSSFFSENLQSGQTFKNLCDDSLGTGLSQVLPKFEPFGQGYWSGSHLDFRSVNTGSF